MTNFGELLKTLSNGGVDFILVGGAAGIAHGASRLTQDVDIVYARNTDNLRHLSDTLLPFQPYLRGAPPGLPFKLDVETIVRGLNFTLITSIGDLDLLGEITGGGTYESLLPHSIELSVFGVQCRCLDLSTLIMVKRAAGRPRDFEAVAELEKIRDDET